MDASVGHLPPMDRLVYNLGYSKAAQNRPEQSPFLSNPMPEFVCLLRGINVGGNNVIKMADLKSTFAEIGCTNVVTYIQSGNVIFSSRQKSQASIAKKISKQIKSEYGFDVPVFVCSRDEYLVVLSEHPFEKAASDIKHLHVTFLHAPPSGDAIRLLSEKAEDFGDEDEYFLVGQSLYHHCPFGYAKTKFTNGFMEKTLGVRATTRNWNTVQKIGALLQPK